MSNSFHFQNSGATFDRIFSVFFFRAIVIDIVTNESLNLDLELPTYNQGFLPIRQKLKPRELEKTQAFVEKYKGTTTNKREATNILQKEFNLSDCDVSM
jgi:hypothetical protein